VAILCPVDPLFRVSDSQQFTRITELITVSRVGILAIARTYETSQIGGLSVYTFDTFCAEILAVFEQNIGIIATNILPMGAFFSRSVRKEATLRGKAPSRAESTRTITRVTSRASSRRGGVSSIRSSLADPKHSTTFVIEGSGDNGAIREYEMEARSIRSVKDSYGDPEAWPKGIIKTVSVEVVEEDNPDVQVPKATAVGAISRISDASMEQDWETILRGGPIPRYA
jgi:hypothetical protein